MIKDKRTNKSNRRILGLAALLSLLTVWAQALSIQHSAASTAAIGYLFLPLYFCGYLFIYAVVGFLWRQFYVACIDKNQRWSFRFFILLLLSGLVAFYILLIGCRVTDTYFSVQYIKTLTSADELNTVYLRSKQEWLGSYRVYWWASIVLNPHTSPQLIQKIADEDAELINERLAPWFDLSPGNDFQRSVKRLIKDREHTLNPK